MSNSIFGKVDSLPHGWNVLSSILLGGAITAVAYALSSAGLAELAGTFLSFWGVFCFTRLFGKVAAARKGKHFTGSTELVRQLQADMSTWIKDRSVLSIFLLGFGAAVLYVAFRSACIAVLGVFGNIWFAVAAGLLLSALIASPVLFRSLGQLVTRDSGSVDMEAAASEPHEPVGGSVEAQDPLAEAEALREYLETENARLEAQKGAEVGSAHEQRA